MKIQVKNERGYRWFDVTVTKDGFLKTKQGDYLLNSFLVKKNGMTNDEAVTIQQQGEAAVLSHPILSKCLCHLGENEGGIFVEDADEAKRREEDEFKKRIAKGEDAISVSPGYFGIRINNRLDKATWNIVRPYATYIEGNESDLEFLDDQGFWNVDKEDVKGWYYKDEAIEALNKAGLKTSYHGIPVKSAKEMYAERARLVAIEKELSAEKRAEEQKRTALLNEFLSLERTYCTSDDTKVASKLDEILIPEMGFEGEDIYGGGKWLMQDDNYIYIAFNNGGDGDDWSLNNLSTGGAGAILYKIEKTREALSVFQKMLAYLPEKEEKDPVRECMAYFVSNNVLPKEIDTATCMGSFIGKALYVKIKKNFFLGITPEKDRVIYLAARMCFFGSSISNNSYFEGNDYSALAFPFNESVYQTWLAALPEWALKAWQKEPIQRGRFYVYSYVLPDNNYALYYCYKHNCDITGVDYSRGVELVSIKRPNSHVTSVWSDGRIINETMVCFNVTGDKWNKEDVEWLQPFVYDYHLNTTQLSDVVSKLVKARCYGFPKSILLNATSYTDTGTICAHENVCVSSVEIGFSNGDTRTFYELEGAFASFDDVAEFYELHAEKESAVKSFNGLVNN